MLLLQEQLLSLPMQLRLLLLPLVKSCVVQPPRTEILSLPRSRCAC
jgi:hypothetical protein